MVAAITIGLVGGPAPYREALSAKLEAVGYSIAELQEADGLVICCTRQELWDQAADAALWTPTVVVITELDIDVFVCALALGAGVVHLDTPTAVMVDVIAAGLNYSDRTIRRKLQGIYLKLGVTDRNAAIHAFDSETAD